MGKYIFSEENKNKILKLFDDGVFIKHICLLIGVSRQPVTDLILQTGRVIKKLKGSNHPSWKGGTGLKHGYMTIYQPEHHRASSIKRTYEHILLLEKYIGRSITKEERIHHIDFVRNNNKLDNLFLCESDSKHKAIQQQYNEIVCMLIKKKIIKFTNGKYFIDYCGKASING